MKKITGVLVGMLVLQPLIVYCARGHLLATVPVHYQLKADLWNSVPQQNLTIALLEAVFAPLVILASRELPLNWFVPTLNRWILPPKTTWLWWLFGLNWLILGSLFTDASWISWGWELWTLLCGVQLLGYIFSLVGANRKTRH